MSTGSHWSTGLKVLVVHLLALRRHVERKAYRTEWEKNKKQLIMASSLVVSHTVNTAARSVSV